MKDRRMIDLHPGWKNPIHWNTQKIPEHRLDHAAMCDDRHLLVGMRQDHRANRFSCALLQFHVGFAVRQSWLGGHTPRSQPSFTRSLGRDILGQVDAELDDIVIDLSFETGEFTDRLSRLHRAQQRTAIKRVEPNGAHQAFGQAPGLPLAECAQFVVVVRE